MRVETEKERETVWVCEGRIGNGFGEDEEEDLVEKLEEKEREIREQRRRRVREKERSRKIFLLGFSGNNSFVFVFHN
jgi:hypothetical protein